MQTFNKFSTISALTPMTINRSTVAIYNYTQDFKSQAQTPDVCHMLKHSQRTGLWVLVVFKKSGHLSKDVTKKNLETRRN